MKLLWEESAWEEYCYWQTQDKKVLKRINVVIKDIQRNSFEGIGKPEPLKENMSGWWSRRIDKTNRIVYCQKGESIIIASCKGPMHNKQQYKNCSTKVSSEKRIPFEIAVDPFYSESNMQRLRESISQMEQNKVVTKTMEELEALAED